MSINQLLGIAKHYIDTAKSDLPISAVAFMGQIPGKELPKPDDDGYIYERKKFDLIFFGFENVKKEYANKKDPNVRDILITQNGTAEIYLPSKQMDSLINSKTPLNTGLGTF